MASKLEAASEPMIGEAEPKENRLSAAFILAAKPSANPYRLRRHLYLRSGLDTRWAFLRYQRNGRAHDIGLGPSLRPSDAATHAERLRLAASWFKAVQQKAQEYEAQLQAGSDPAEEKERIRNATVAAVARTMTFKDAALAYIEAHSPGWKSAVHRAQWKATLEQYAYPVIGHLPIGDVNTSHVLEVLKPIWTTKNATATKLQGRLARILGYSAAHGWRSVDAINPAQWRGHLEHLLPKPSKIAPVEHHAALPVAELPAFMRRLSGQVGVAALALRFTVLTAARTSEVLQSTWDEIDREGRVWTVPASRMKASRPHRVPLSSEALRVLDLLEAPREPEKGNWLFASPAHGSRRPLSNMGMSAVLRRMGRSDVTTHGFRSCFRIWCSENGVEREQAELALAHVFGSGTERAYARSDLLEPRRRVMERWARFCASRKG